MKLCVCAYVCVCVYVCECVCVCVYVCVHRHRPRVASPRRSLPFSTSCLASSHLYTHTMCVFINKNVMCVCASVWEVCEYSKTCVIFSLFSKTRCFNQMLCMFPPVHTNTHTRTPIHIYVYMCTSVYMCIYVYICVYMCIYVYICV